MEQEFKAGVTRAQWITYRKIQDFGITNMFDIKRVVALSNDELDKESCLYIMEHYTLLQAHYNDE